MHKKLFLFALILLYAPEIFAQTGRIGIVSEYNIPKGDLKWIYKNAPGIKVGLSKFGDRNNIYGISIGFMKFKPIADTLYYLYENGNDIGYGTAVYGDYSILHLGVDFNWEYRLTKKTYFFFGVSGGYNYCFYKYQISDDFSSEDATIIDSKGAVIPVVGFLYKINESFDLVPCIKYNLLFSIGSTDPSAIDYNERVGTFNYFYSIGLGLNYNF